MLVHLALDGIEGRSSVEAAVQRWVTRLERTWAIARCSMSIRIDSRVLLGKRARIDLRVATEQAEVAISHMARLRDPDALYVVISDAFRDVHRRLGGGTAR